MIEELDKRINNLWKSKKLSMTQITIDASFDYDLTVRKMPKFEGKVAEAKIVSNFNTTEKKEKKLREALAKYPNSDKMKEILAFHYADKHEWQKGLHVLGNVDETSSLEFRMAFNWAPQRSDVGYWYAFLLKGLGYTADACHVVKRVVNKSKLTPRQINNYKRAMGLPVNQPIICPDW